MFNRALLKMRLCYREPLCILDDTVQHCDSVTMFTLSLDALLRLSRISGVTHGWSLATEVCELLRRHQFNYLDYESTDFFCKMNIKLKFLIHF